MNSQLRTTLQDIIGSPGRVPDGTLERLQAAILHAADTGESSGPWKVQDDDFVYHRDFPARGYYVPEGMARTTANAWNRLAAGVAGKETGDVR